MFSYNVLRQHYGNVLETFVEYVAAIAFANVFTTFPQCCGNVVQPYTCIVTWDITHHLQIHTLTSQRLENTSIMP